MNELKDLGERLKVSACYDSLLAITNELDGMIDRMQRLMDRSKSLCDQIRTMSERK